MAVVGGMDEIDGGERGNVARKGESSGLHCLQYRAAAKLSGGLALDQQASVST